MWLWVLETLQVFQLEPFKLCFSSLVVLELTEPNGSSTFAKCLVLSLAFSNSFSVFSSNIFLILKKRFFYLECRVLSWAQLLHPECHKIPLGIVRNTKAEALEEVSFPKVALKEIHSGLLVPSPVGESLEWQPGMSNGTSESGTEVPGISKLP